jgi:pimeloyl-ACP methyl ester carboxylesterase
MNMKEIIVRMLLSFLFLTGIEGLVIFFNREQAFFVYWLYFLIALAILAVLLITVMITGFLKLKAGRTGMKEKEPSLFISSLSWTVFVFLFLLVQVIISQWSAFSPTDEGFAYFETVDLNGTMQTISVRGTSKNNPVILFLAGGPGGSQIPATREFLTELEKDYTIVNWEQPGVGKSYNAREVSSLTPDLYLKDAHTLTTYLKKEFNREKIYLIGESWGSYLGIRLAHDYGKDYHAFIGTGQMVDFTETEQYCYELAKTISEETGDLRQLQALENLKRPPIRGQNISLEVGTYLTYLYRVMVHDPDINHTNWNTFKIIFSPEYGIIDTVNYFKGLYFTFSEVYQQLYEVDLRETYTTFDIPIYMLHGRHDINAPGYLVEDYFKKIHSPDKRLIWFEHSGHNPWIEESNAFHRQVKELFSHHITP